VSFSGETEKTQNEWKLLIAGSEKKNLRNNNKLNIVVLKIHIRNFPLKFSFSIFFPQQLSNKKSSHVNYITSNVCLEKWKKIVCLENKHTRKIARTLSTQCDGEGYRPLIYLFWNPL
jgi:hypothetical protein